MKPILKTMHNGRKHHRIKSENNEKYHLYNSNNLGKRLVESTPKNSFMKIDHKNILKRSLSNDSEKYFIFKDKALDNRISSIYKVKTLNKKNVFKILFLNINLYDVLPTLSKVLVLESQLSLRQSFDLMAEMSTGVAIIWSKELMVYIGILDTLDYMHIMTHFASIDREISFIHSELDKWTLERWKNFEPNSGQLLSLSTKNSVSKAVKTLIASHFDKIAVKNERNGNILFLLDNKCILNFVFHYLPKLPMPVYMNKTIGELKIGTTSNVTTVYGDQTLLEAWQIMIYKKINSLPVLDRTETLIGFFYRSDVEDIMHHIRVSLIYKSIQDVLIMNAKPFSGITICRMNDTLMKVMSIMVYDNRTSLMIVSTENTLEGVISTTDVMEYLDQESITEYVTSPKDVNEFPSNYNSP